MAHARNLALQLAFACLLGSGAWAQAPESRGLALKPGPGYPAQERRVALVIGNGAYPEGPLKNPVNDARAVAQALERCGFEVTRLENAPRDRMGQALRQFGDALLGGGVGLFYFAGHGMQVKGRNYLIPVGAGAVSEDEVAYNALDADAVLAKMETAGNRLNILILDACRNNPFVRGSRSGAAGLAQMDAPAGSYVAFATGPGRTAADGSDGNGLYTRHLLANLDTPGLKLEDVFKRVRNGVMDESGNAQVPWESSSLRGDFYFVPGGPPAAGAQPPAVAGGPMRRFLAGAEAQRALAAGGFETPAESEARLAKLPPLRVGTARLLQESYDLTAQRLPVDLQIEAWASGRVKQKRGTLVIDRASAKALCETGAEQPLLARFGARDGQLLLSGLVVAGGHDEGYPVQDLPRGRLLFYRHPHLIAGVAITLEIEMGGRQIGSLRPGECFTVLVPGGPAKATAFSRAGATRYDRGALELAVRPGRTIYVLADAGKYEEVPEEKGQAASHSLKNLGEQVLE